MKKEKGSIMILTIVAVLILSIMVTGLLNVGTTEMYTTQNFHLSKVAYYTAVEGVEELRNDIANEDKDIKELEATTYSSPLGTTTGGKTAGLKSYYISGTLEDMEANTPKSLGDTETQDFPTPHVPGTSLSGGDTNVFLKLWQVDVTSKAKVGNRVAYREISAGILQVSEK
jgi:hypothetical protein